MLCLFTSGSSMDVCISIIVISSSLVKIALVVLILFNFEHDALINAERLADFLDRVVKESFDFVRPSEWDRSGLLPERCVVMMSLGNLFLQPPFLTFDVSWVLAKAHVLVAIVICVVNDVDA